MQNTFMVEEKDDIIFVRFDFKVRENSALIKILLD